MFLSGPILENLMSVTADPTLPDAHTARRGGVAYLVPLKKPCTLFPLWCRYTAPVIRVTSCIHVEGCSLHLVVRVGSLGRQAFLCYAISLMEAPPFVGHGDNKGTGNGKCVFQSSKFVGPSVSVYWVAGRMICGLPITPGPM